MDGLSDQEVALVAAALAKLQPGVLPFDIFHQFARLAALPLIELVPLRKNSATGHTEVLLLRRPADDPVWPSQQHTPGTVVRASDTPGDFRSAIDRVFSQELGLDAPFPEPVFVQNLLNRSKRGMEAAHIYWVELTQKPPVGVFYDVGQLPPDFVESQLNFLSQAVQSFEQTK